MSFVSPIVENFVRFRVVFEFQSFDFLLFDKQSFDFHMLEIWELRV